MAEPPTLVRTRNVPQSHAADDRQVPNSAGGFTFTLDDEARLRRFLVLGTDGGTYYVGAGDLTRDNAEVVLRMARENPRGLVDVIVDVSLRGAAPKQNPTLFALAAACASPDADGRSYALSLLPQVARTGTHLFLFARYVEQFRGWGRGLRRAVGGWYTSKSVDDLAYQIVKYRQREGWSHRDLLRLSHPATIEPDRRALFDWTCGREADASALRLVEGFRRVNDTDVRNVPGLVQEYGLSWEMLPDDALGQPATWGALLDNGMPQTALMRQLPRLTRLGVLKSMGDRTAQVAAQLRDPERLLKARVHPINVLVAQRTYASGMSARGESTWQPVREIVDALDAAFYAAFGAVEPTGKRTMLALDVSGSMGAPISNMPLSCREASAALALVTAATEQRYEIVGFTAAGGGGWGWSRDAVLTPLAISPRQRLDDALRTTANLPFGGTDCSLPMRHALQRGIEVDTFVIYTDNEAWAGPEHPHVSLRKYRQATGIPARLVVVGMTATPFSIADPTDPGMLDVAGFDSAVPNLIGDFSRGL